VRQSRSLGSARGAARKGGPYRDPGRGCHDAIAAIYNTCKGPSARRVWALLFGLPLWRHVAHL